MAAMAMFRKLAVRPASGLLAARPAGAALLRPFHAGAVLAAPQLPGPAGKHMSQYDDAGFDVGDDLDQAVGLQHAELVADLQDKPFFQECLIAGPFGTVDNPVKIESVLGYRIVGCTGGEGDQEHDVAWFELHEGKPLACDLCGQYFELVKVAPPSVTWDAA